MSYLFLIFSLFIVPAKPKSCRFTLIDNILSGSIVATGCVLLKVKVTNIHTYYWSPWLLERKENDFS